MANEIRKKYGTTVRFTDSTGTVAFTLQNLATGGRRSPSAEFSVDGYGPQGYHIKFGGAGFETAPVVNDKVELYAIQYGIGATASDGNNDDGNADGAVSSINKLLNLGAPLLTIYADEAVADIPIFGEGDFEGLARHLAFAVWNYSTDNLQNTANSWYVDATPYVYEIQDSA